MANDDFNQLLIDFSNFDDFDESHFQVNQESKEAWKLRRNLENWENEKKRRTFYRLFRGEAIGYWNHKHAGLREIFSREDIDWFLTEAVDGHDRRFIRFVIRTGYKDEPDLDENGKPLSRRTTPIHHIKSSWVPSFFVEVIPWDTIIRDFFRIYDRFDVNYTDDSGLSHFHVACMCGCLYLVKKLFKLVQDPNFLVQETGDSPLHLALRYGKKEVAEWLLRKGADHNSVNADGLTPLHMACVGGSNDDLLEMLFKFSNDKHQPVEIDATDKLSNRPLHLALKEGHDKVAEWLLRKGANPYLANLEGLTPLHIICKRDKDDDLLEKFFEINNEKHQTLQIDALDKLGRTPLQWAVVSFLPHVVDVLLDHGADLSGFVFPTASHFDERFKLYTHEHFKFKLRLASGPLTLAELLENRGYEWRRSDTLTIMTLFAKYELFQNLENIDIDTRLDVELSVECMIKNGVKLLTYQDYLEFARSEKKWYLIYSWRRRHVGIYLCEKLSRGFFRTWALEFFMELTHCQLPIECCEIIIDESFTNKNLYDICLAATGQNSL